GRVPRVRRSFRGLAGCLADGADGALGDGPAVNLGRAVVYAERPDLAGEACDRKVLGDTETAAHLSGAVHDAEDRLGGEGLGDRRGVRGVRTLVEFPARLHEQCAGRGDVDLVVGDHLLDHAEIAEAGAESFTLR